MSQLTSPILTARQNREAGARGSALVVFKRFLDIAVGSLALIVSLPILVVCIILIKKADPGPAIYSQWRVGKDGWLFRIYKLRTMVLPKQLLTDTPPASPRDERVIGCCRWMRKSHIDELPQLINIIRGQMSLVGPRPEQPEIHRILCMDLAHFNDRLAVKPGLTGLAQVVNGYTNDLAGNQRKLDLDLKYIEQMNWRNELKLLWLTVPKFWDRKAC